MTASDTALRRHRWALGGLFVAALLLRLLYLFEARSLPLFHHLISDGRAYVDWADAIRAGDLWSRGQQVFYQAPLYAYTLAAIRSLLGESLWAIRLCQAVAGAAACVLLVVAGGRWFDRRTGWIAGIALALYAPAIFFDGVINKASLALLASVSVFTLLGQRSGTRPPLTWAATGLALGLLILLRENALLLVPVVGLWLWTGPDAEGRGSRRHRGRCSLLLAAGLAVVLLPVALRNQVIGGTFTLTTVQAGPNLWIGNNPQAEGTYRPLVAGRSDTPFERADAVRLAEQALGRELSPRQVSRYWSARAWAYARAEPAAWLRLTARKLLMVMHRYEQPDGEDLTLYASRSRLLRWLGWIGHYGVILPLAVVGWILCWPRWRRLWPLAVTTLVLLGSVALFFVFARYRHPALPPLLLFAAAGSTGLAPAWHQSRRRLGAALAAGLVAAALVNAPFDFGQRRNGAMARNNLGTALAAEQRWPEAAAAYRDALAIDPGLLEGHLNLGSTLRVLGQQDAAIQHLEVAYRLSTDDADVAHQLGTALAARGDLTQAEPVLQQALALRPDSVPAALDLSWVLVQLKDLDQAVRVVRQGLQRTPGEASLSLRLAILLLQRPERSADDLEQAIRMGLAGCETTGYRNRDTLRVTLAALVAADRVEQAIEVARHALGIATTAADQGLANELRQALKSFE